MDTRFKKGMAPWNKGKKGVQIPSLASRKKMSDTRKRLGLKPVPMPGDKNPKWKGDNVSYSGLHHWIRRHFGKPLKCELCEVEGLGIRQYHWANVSGEYKRDRSDWKRLCVSCHIYHDKNNIKI